jgi:hypothetical protein
VSLALQVLERLVSGKLTELDLRSRLDLANAFLADTQLQTDLQERQPGYSTDPVPAFNDPLLTLVESTEPAPERRSP